MIALEDLGNLVTLEILEERQKSGLKDLMT